MFGDEDQGALVVGASPLDQNNVPPTSVVLANALPNSDPPKPAYLVQPQTGGILRKDAGLDCPDAGLLAAGDKRVEQLAAHTSAARQLVDVHAVLHDPAIHAPLGERYDRGPPDHRRVLSRDKAMVGQVPCVPSRPVGHRCLEGKVPGGDTLLVDAPNRGQSSELM